MQLTINLPDTTYQTLKSQAEQQSQPLDTWIANYLTLISPRFLTAQNWPADFFEQTAGCFADMPLERIPQGDYEQRLEWL